MVAGTGEAGVDRPGEKPREHGAIRPVPGTAGEAVVVLEPAAAELGECTCMAFFDRLTGRESPAHGSECHGTCEVPGYEEYAVNRGATLKVVVNRGDCIFIYRSLGEFAGL